MQTMAYGQLTGGRSGFGLEQPAQHECDVTCSVEFANGKSRMYNGIFIFKGAPVTGIELDHEAEFPLEYGRPEGDLRIFDFKGKICKVRAWIQTAKGPQVVLENTFPSTVVIEEGCLIPVVGPELRYML